MAVTTALSRLLAPLLAGGPARVFPAVGAGARDRVEDLRLARGVELVDTPRHATVLLVAGEVPDACADALRRVHDQVPSPRATLAWDADAPLGPAPTAHGSAAGEAAGAPRQAGDEAAVAARDLQAELLGGEAEGDGPWLPDEPPSPWRGRGDHGQGGEGMMGGTPYGRPMAMTGEDVRDGLALDRLSFTVGPFFPPLPPGLVLAVTLQGDVVQDLDVVRRPFPQPLDPVFGRVLSGPVPVADLEVARARALLRGTSRVLRAAGAPALADRALRLAAAGTGVEGSPAAAPAQADVESLREALDRTGVLLALPPEMGPLGGEAAAVGGLSGRAAGVAPDLRARVPTWHRLGFTAAPGRGDHARGRFMQRLVEAERALRLAASAAADDLTVGPLERVEGPEGPVGVDLDPGDGPSVVARLLPDLLRGMEWGEAVVVLAGLPLTPTPATGATRDGVGS